MSDAITTLLQSKKEINTDAVVIGAGIIGLLTSLSLAEAGMSVTLIDRQTAGQEASFAGGGILSSLEPWRLSPAMQQLIRWSQACYPDFTRQLHDKTDTDPEFLRCGLTFIDETLPLSAQACLTEADSDYCRIPLEDAKKEFPNITIHSHVDLLPNVGQIRNPKLLKSTIELVHQNPKIRLIENHPITDFKSDGKQLTHALSSSSQFSADHFILTSGAWSNLLLQKIQLETDIKPIKGEMIRVRPQQKLISTITMKGDCYLIPRKNGTILIGSTVEDCGFNKEISPDTRTQLLEKAIDLVPQLSQATVIDHWAGLRPGTSREAPVIDRLPNVENGYICAGHFRYGLVSAPGSARLMADLVLNRKGPLDRTLYQW